VRNQSPENARLEAACNARRAERKAQEDAADEAQRRQQEAYRASLTPEQRKAQDDAEQERFDGAMDDAAKAERQRQRSHCTNEQVMNGYCGVTTP